MATTTSTDTFTVGESILTFALTCIAYLNWMKQNPHNLETRNSSYESDFGTEDCETSKEDCNKLRWPVYRINSRLSYSDLLSEAGDSKSSGTGTSDSWECDWWGQEERNLDHFEDNDNPTMMDQSMRDFPQLDSQLTNHTNPLEPTKTNTVADANKSFNSNIIPKRLIMVRHGQSEGNVNEKIYAVKPDNSLSLTDLGWEQAYMAGKVIRENVLQDEPVHFILSPYVRTLETFHGILTAWCDPSKELSHITNLEEREQKWYYLLRKRHNITWHEDPRIREQDFGNYQDPETMSRAKKERHYFGYFYYRFPNGESASDVYDRVSTFLDSLWRSFHSQRCNNYVIVTHGISIRVLLSRYYRYTIDQFHTLANPKNCEMVILGHDGHGKLKLQGRCELKLQTKKLDVETNTDGETTSTEEASKHKKSFRNASWIFDDHLNNSILASIFNTHSNETRERVTGFKFHQRLRTLPPKYIKKRKRRLSPFDPNIE